MGCLGEKMKINSRETPTLFNYAACSAAYKFPRGRCTKENTKHGQFKAAKQFSPVVCNYVMESRVPVTAVCFYGSTCVHHTHTPHTHTQEITSQVFI